MRLHYANEVHRLSTVLSTATPLCNLERTYIMLNFITTHGTIVDKKPALTAGDPRANFVKNASKQIEFLTNGGYERQNPWFTIETDGKLLVSLRNGFKNLPLDEAGRQHVLVASKEGAIALLTDAIEKCKTGALDQLFAENKVVRKSKKAKIAAAEVV